LEDKKFSLILWLFKKSYTSDASIDFHSDLYQSSKSIRDFGFPGRLTISWTCTSFWSIQISVLLIYFIYAWKNFMVHFLVVSLIIVNWLCFHIPALLIQFNDINILIAEVFSVNIFLSVWNFSMILYKYENDFLQINELMVNNLTWRVSMEIKLNKTYYTSYDFKNKIFRALPLHLSVNKIFAR
jgi:hypothetical protein